MSKLHSFSSCELLRLEESGRPSRKLANGLPHFEKFALLGFGMEVCALLKLKCPPSVCSSLSSCNARRHSRPMLNVCRPLVQSQLFTIAIPSLRLMDWNHAPLVPQQV